MQILYKPHCGHDEHFTFPSIAHIILKANGFWPTVDNGPFPILVKLYTYWNWINIAFVAWLFCGEIGYCILNSTDVANAAQSLCTALYCVMNLIRMVHMRYEVDCMKSLLRLFADKIWIKKDSHPNIFKRCVKAIKPNDYIGISIVTTLFIYSILPIAVFITNGQTLKSPDKVLPILMAFPYDEQKPFNYVITSLACFFSGFICVTSSYAMDGIFLLFVSFACGSFEVLHVRIGRLMPECHAEWLRRYGDEDTSSTVRLNQLQDLYTKRLNEIILHHNDLIGFCKILENFFQFPLMVNFVTSMLAIGFGGFQFIISGGNSLGDFSRFFLFLLSVTGQLYVICSLGTSLIISSTDTAQHLFMCNWEGGKISKNSPLILNDNFPLWEHIKYNPSGKDFQHKLIFMILRSHRPVQLTAMKFTTLSMETFCRILSSSLSYFALLKTFLDKQ